MPSSDEERQEKLVSDEHLETTDDPRVSEYRDVPDAELLRARGLFVARPDRLALVVGGEGAGLSEGVSASAGFRVRIPMRPAIDSLNLAVATAIALSRLSRLSRLTRESDPT